MAAVAGDVVQLQPSGAVAVNGVPRAAPPLQCDERTPPSVFPGKAAGSTSDARTIPDGTIFVLGDCPARSTDSRAWGPLPLESVVARPVVRVWPPERQGTIDESLDLNPFLRLVQGGGGSGERK